MARIKKLERQIELMRHAMNRYVPCPDCRDKVEAGDCQRCARQRAERHRDEAIDALREMKLLFQSALLCASPEIARDGMVFVRKADALIDLTARRRAESRSAQPIRPASAAPSAPDDGANQPERNDGKDG